jgi:hypothetical protein
MTRSNVVLAGIVGLFAALLVCVGEFILHYDALARFSADYEFFKGISDQRSTLGHFIAVLSAPLYIIGCWHIRKMLAPASERWSMVAFLVGAYGFAVGAIWIGSRASISALVNTPELIEVSHLISLYDFRYETLLQIIRIAVLVLSVIFVWLTMSGRSHYPKWMAWLNPILLIVVSFVVYALVPAVGKYLMPIALNVAFAVFFVASTVIAVRKGV